MLEDLLRVLFILIIWVVITVWELAKLAFFLVLFVSAISILIVAVFTL